MSDNVKFAFILSLFSLMLVGNGLLALKTSHYLPLNEKEMLKGNKLPLSGQNASYGANLASGEALIPETLSDGTRAIRIKTNYEENEIIARDASEKACAWAGLGKTCVEDLMGISYAETRSFNYKAQGDGSQSWGLHQIHLGYHPDVTKEQALDPYWSAKWTIKRLISKGYLVDRDYAIQSHNGTPNKEKTLAYLSVVNEYINK